MTPRTRRCHARGKCRVCSGRILRPRFRPIRRVTGADSCTGRPVLPLVQGKHPAPSNAARPGLGRGLLPVRRVVDLRQPFAIRRHGAASRRRCNPAVLRLPRPVSRPGRRLAAELAQQHKPRCAAVRRLVDAHRMAARHIIHRLPLARRRLFAKSAEPAGRLGIGTRRLWRRFHCRLDRRLAWANEQADELRRLAQAGGMALDNCAARPRRLAAENGLDASGRRTRHR